VSHANAQLTPAGRLRLAQLVVDKGLDPAARRRAVELFGYDREAVGRPLPGARPGRHGRPVLAPKDLTVPHPDPGRAAGAGASGVPSLGTSPNRLPAADGGLDRAQDSAPLRLPTAGLDRSRDRGQDQVDSEEAPLLRARIPWRPGARRHQEARPNPRRRRLASRRAAGRAQELGRAAPATGTPTTPSTTAHDWATANSSPTRGRKPQPSSGSAQTPSSSPPASS
jgi:hypothetical protein